MTSNADPSLRTVNAETSLEPHRKTFLEKLDVQGYAPVTIRQYKRTIERFCEEVKSRGFAVGLLDGVTVHAIREAVLRKTCQSGRTYAKYHLGRFIEYLAESGAANLPASPSENPTAMDCLREEYDAYLRHQRALSDASIRQCMQFLKRFMAFRFGEVLGDLNDITPDDIVTFLTQLSKGSKPYRDKTPPTHLRNLFKFLFWSGKTKRNLADSVPPVAHPRPMNVPRYVKPEEVQRLIDAVRSDDAAGRRNYAMLLLIARLGLRAPEVIAIQLEDINWRVGEILIRGKGKLHDRMPLPADVGEAIVDYIRNGRVGTSRSLFLCSRAPYRPFVDAQIVNMLLRKAFKKTGLKPPQKYVGSHVLRHASPPIFWRKTTTFAPYRSCSGTKTFAPP